MLISNPLKNVKKMNDPKTSYKQNNLTNMNKSGIVKISVMFLLNTFFNFSMNLKSAWNSVCFDTFIEFCKNNLFSSYHYFIKALKTNPHEISQKNKKLFINMS